MTVRTIKKPKRKQLRILVLDDEEAIRESLINYLEDEGFAAFGSASAEEAFEMLRQAEFDIAIVDQRLPDMSGDEFILSSHQEKPGLRYIIHTGSGEYRCSKKIKACGVDYQNILHKPLFDLSFLLEKIRILTTRPYHKF